MAPDSIRIRLFRTPDLPTVEEIFFASSARRDFSDEGARRAFVEKWLGYYLENERENFFVVELMGKITGYLTGCLDSYRAEEYFSTRVPSFSLFRDQFETYPAHLHVNLADGARGQGLGALLVDEFVKIADRGIHIVTAPDSRNRSFYTKKGFDFSLERSLGGNNFLFMGRRPH